MCKLTTRLFTSPFVYISSKGVPLIGSAKMLFFTFIHGDMMKVRRSRKKKEELGKLSLALEVAALPTAVLSARMQIPDITTFLGAEKQPTLSPE